MSPISYVIRLFSQGCQKKAKRSGVQSNPFFFIDPNFSHMILYLINEAGPCVYVDSDFRNEQPWLMNS